MQRLRWGRVSGTTALWAVVGLAGLAAGTAILNHHLRAPSSRARPSLAEAIRHIEPGWDVEISQELPEAVNSLVVATEETPSMQGCVFVGTAPTGNVYKYNPMLPTVIAPVALGLGDQVNFGTCYVNRLAIRDLDGDGVVELLASTSQVTPRGRPRLYVWSFTSSLPILRGMARPAIQSSWSHGLGFLDRPGTTSESMFITFCGYGEVVEYRLQAGRAESGFHSESLSWKVVGQLPASGEWTQSADADNDGRVDVCLATGFAEKQAAIQVHAGESPGAALTLSHRIDEGGRFGNVRFLVGGLRGDGSNDVVAWWCTDHLYGGDCEMVRYRLDPGGVTERTVIARGPANTLWPDDGQTALEDLDGDGRVELWFAAKDRLWRYQPARSPEPAVMLRIDGGLGSMAVGTLPNADRPTMFLAWGERVLRLDRAAARSGAETARSGSSAPLTSACGPG